MLHTPTPHTAFNSKTFLFVLVSKCWSCSIEKKKANVSEVKFHTRYEANLIH